MFVYLCVDLSVCLCLWLGVGVFVFMYLRKRRRGEKSVCFAQRREGKKKGAKREN